MAMPHSVQGDSMAMPNAFGIERVGSRAGTGSILAGQGKLADVGSKTDVAQERSSQWCQDLLIALLFGTVFSHSPGIALAVRKRPFLPLILWQFLSPGQRLAQLRDSVFRKRLSCCAQFSSWAAPQAGKKINMVTSTW